MKEKKEEAPKKKKLKFPTTKEEFGEWIEEQMKPYTFKSWEEE